MKRSLYLVLLLTLFSGGLMLAREIRTPLPFDYAYLHYPLPRPKPDESAWNVDVWGAGYFRQATQAFLDKDTTKKEPLDAIFFGLADFTGIQAFAAGTTSPTNPFLQFATLSPRFDYNEKGAYFGLTLDHGLKCGTWHIGMRARMPYRDISVDLNSCCNIQQASASTLADVVVEQNEVIQDPNNTVSQSQTILKSFAYRLDFLSALQLVQNQPSPLVIYNTGATPGHVTINNNVVDTSNPTLHSVTSGPNASVINLIGRTDGTVPPLPFAEIDVATSVPAVQNAPCLAADGSGVANNQRVQFCTGTNYTPLGANKVNQSKLWVVGTATTTPAPPAAGAYDVTDLTPEARNIQTAVDSLISGISTDVIAFFLNNGISFATQREMGAGDLIMDFYLNHQWCDYFAEGVFAIKFPTGRRLLHPNNLLAMPLGNNHHYEVRLGGVFGWEAIDWLYVKADAYYNAAIKAKEKVCASFTGATVKNIGPVIDANVSWQYFVGHVDLTFLHPCNGNLGMNIGYELYVKGQDRVRFLQTTAEDFLGNTQLLDPTVIEQRTKVIANKLRTELFYYGNYWELYAGWNHVFAGKNAPNDTDWYLGMTVYF